MVDRFDDAIDDAIDGARAALRDAQAPAGHWVFELEADATIPAEYILLEHFLDEIDAGVETRLARYLCAVQGEDGGWPLFPGGEANLSASVKAYYALKLTGERPDAGHMMRARETILRLGGAARCNVFTRITLALFAQAPWRAVPTMPVEIMLLPRWFPFHLTKISYWSRTVLVPLLILMALKPVARNPTATDIAELFIVPPFEERRYLVNPTGARLGNVFLAIDRLLKAMVPVFPKFWQRRAIDRAVEFITKRLNGEHGLGGIFPAMSNAVMALHTLGYADDHPDLALAKQAIKGLLTFEGDSGYCQPCLSPVWDTALAMLALAEAEEDDDRPLIHKAAGWLRDRQIFDADGDWRMWRPDLRGGAWAFQYANDYYPDTDDTSVVVMALDRTGDEDYGEAIERGVEWIVGMQSANGGWGSFDADNTCSYLNHIPFADHGALLDPPTADVSARCVCLLAQRGFDSDDQTLSRGLQFLIREQEQDGSWYGRWGTNYIYGTWSVLCALKAAGTDPAAPEIRRAVDWLKSRQLEDGGWGEDCASYWPDRRDEVKASMPSQTSWALLALMNAGEVESEAVRRGVEFLLKAPKSGGVWPEDLHNAVGFPRIFFLKYHGYGAYFPLWALARFRRLRSGREANTRFGM